MTAAPKPPAVAAPPAPARGELDAGTEGAGADVIVTVHDAIEDVRRCLASLVEHGGEPPARLIVVNDGSDATTSEWLREFATGRAEVELIEHPTALGYTRAVNAGLRVSGAPHVVLLNSDTVVTPGWLRGLVRCAESDPRIGIVGPLSNAASWQNVPALTDASGAFAVNALPTGMTPRDMAALVSRLSPRRYPRTPFVNGFCFLIERAVIDAIGIMDEVAFPVGYGEENDYAIRAAAAGFRLAIADDVYVYHAKSRSFGHERRRELSRAGTASLHAKHGEARVQSLVAEAKSLPLDDLRAALTRALDERHRAVVDPTSLRILFLLPVKGGGGGAHSVVQEAAGMRRLGVQAHVGIRPRDAEDMHRLYADVPRVEELFLCVHAGNLLAVAANVDVCVATAYTAVDLLARVASAFPRILPAYYVQDYEPHFFEPTSPEAEHARDSYTRVPRAVAFAKTDWLVREVRRHHGVEVHRVQASLDHEHFHPVARPFSTTLSVAAMIRPRTPRRGAERTLRVLRELCAAHPGRVDVHLFGAPEIDADFAARCWGVLNRREVAALLRRCDVFVDLSDYQAFGRTAIEAMASGCVAVVPRAGGSDEFARDGENALVVDTSDEAECLQRLSALVDRREMLLSLRREGLSTAAKYSVHRAAMSELELFSLELAKHRAALEGEGEERPRALYLVPERDSSGRVTHAGYARLALPWQNPALWAAVRPVVVGRGELPRPEPGSIAVVQGSAVDRDSARLVPWILELQAAGGRLIVELGAERPPDKAILGWLVNVGDALLVAHEAMSAEYQAPNQQVFVVPTRLDELCWATALPCRAPPPRGPGLRLGLVAPLVMDEHARSLEGALRALLTARGAEVAVELIDPGHGVPLAAIKPSRLGYRPYPERAERLRARLDWDIALVLPGRAAADDTTQQFLEAAVLGIPAITASVPALHGLARDGETALVCPPETGAWTAALARLLDDPELRAALAFRAHAEVRAERTIGSHSSRYAAIIEQVVALPVRCGPNRALALPPTSGLVPDWVRKTRTLGPKAQRPRASLWTRLQDAFRGAPDRIGRAPGASFERKLRKFRRNPRGFLADSRYLLLRLLGALAYPRPELPARWLETGTGEL